jgi:WD40 repeat protein
MSEENSKKIVNLHENSINSIQIAGDIIYSCCDHNLNKYDQNSSKQETIFESETDDIGIVRLFDDKHLLITNSTDLHLFNVDSLKPLNKYTFCKDTINTIDVNSDKTLLACGDDTGHVKLLDVRMQPSCAQVEMKLKKNLKKHTNLCFSLEFNRFNPTELMTSSYDCTVAKWDLRNLKNTVSSVSVNEILETLIQPETSEFVSTMTPCFVHCLRFSHKDRLLVGIENGLGLGLSTENLELRFSKQLQRLNSALTDFAYIQDWDTWACSGNDGNIRFFKICHETDNLVLLDKSTLQHGFKVNCLFYANMRLYVADTTNDLTVYDLNRILSE